jgi:YD repeat-containing protein
VRRATLGNGLIEQYAYEATTGRLASIKTGLNETATLQNLEYEWDLAGNLEERVDQLLSRTETFDYDALDRLTGVVRNPPDAATDSTPCRPAIPRHVGHSLGRPRPACETGNRSMETALSGR